MTRSACDVLVVAQGASNETHVISRTGDTPVRSESTIDARFERRDRLLAAEDRANADIASRGQRPEDDHHGLAGTRRGAAPAEFHHRCVRRGATLSVRRDDDGSCAVIERTVLISRHWSKNSVEPLDDSVEDWFIDEDASGDERRQRLTLASSSRATGAHACPPVPAELESKLRAPLAWSLTPVLDAPGVPPRASPVERLAFRWQGAKELAGS